MPVPRSNGPSRRSWSRARDHAVTELTALGDTVDAAVIGVRNASTPTCWPPEIIDSGGRGRAAGFAVRRDNFGLADDGTVAIVGDRGLWSPHVAGITVEASAAMDDMVVRGVVQAIGSTC